MTASSYFALAIAPVTVIVAAATVTAQGSIAMRGQGVAAIARDGSDQDYIPADDSPDIHVHSVRLAMTTGFAGPAGNA
ncbi:hypothetical protein EKN06_01275 [Croceicoccus ponticola]|uniref:Uncharacterized protein n=1 Tax=Croceicoccus ponticola TaxID=2217664 RepID=A0A437GZW0_9SPHN|nr:hypothetical protein [Croceicoccus ponticola]RVQ68889.1 hypothetical protein EKN06_01275 [Croceicoccus ponticola]